MLSSIELQDLLQQAIEAAKSGDKARARVLLIEVTEANPSSEVAWMWRASVSLTPKDAAWCLTKVLDINPGNRQAQEWLDKIRLLQEQTPAVTSPLSLPSSELPPPVRSTGAHRFTPPPDQPTVENLPSVSPDQPTVPSLPRAAATVQAMPAVSVSPVASSPTGLATPKPALTKTDELENRPPESDATSKVILAVDDSLTVRRVITQALEGCGYRVVTAADGYEALVKLKEVTPDLVVLDVALPGGMDGYQLCRQIRALKVRPAIPVVMLSSRESLLDKVQSRLAGAAQYMTKPFKTEELVLNIRRHLKE